MENRLKIIGILTILITGGIMCIDTGKEGIPEPEVTTSVKLGSTNLSSVSTSSVLPHQDSGLNTQNQSELGTTAEKLGTTTTISELGTTITTPELGTTTTLPETTILANLPPTLKNPKSTIVSKAEGRLITFMTVEAENARSVSIDFSPINGELTEMRDDGLNGDFKADDGIYTLQIQTPIGSEREEKELNIIAMDSEGNNCTSAMQITIVKAEEKGSAPCDIDCPI